MKLKFHHGLGDTIMFRNVIDVLDEPVELFLHPALGQTYLFHKDAKVTVVTEPSSEFEFREIAFHMENSMRCCSGRPTKIRICLEHEFGLILSDYKIRPLPLADLGQIDTDAVRLTKRFLRGLEHYVVCHFQGTWNPHIQNPNGQFADRIASSIIEKEFGVVVINYDYLFHNPKNKDFGFVDGNRIRSTFGRLPMEFESLWYLLRHADAFIGVASGPLNAAICMDIPVANLEKGTYLIGDLYDELDRNVVTVDIADENTQSMESIEHFLGEVEMRTS